MTEAFPSLNDALKGIDEKLTMQLGADVMAIFLKQIKELQGTHIEERAPKLGEKIPSFELEDITSGARVKSEQLLAKGGIVITFYRGQWCPYCNTALKAVAQAQPKIATKGYTLVAISPQTKEKALVMRQESQLTNLVQLRDENNNYARKLGLVFDLGPAVGEVYAKLGISSQAFFGHNGAFEIPVPATIVVNKQGVITYVFAHADYTKRAEPNAVIAAIEQ